MELDNIFNGTILVLWAILLIPYALREDKKWMIGLTGAIILVIEVTLAMHYSHREYPYNFLVGILSFLIALSAGFAYYFFHSKHEE